PRSTLLVGNRASVESVRTSDIVAAVSRQAWYVFSALHQVTLVPEGQRKIAGGKRACRAVAEERRRVRERSPRMGGPMDFAPWKGAGKNGAKPGPDQTWRLRVSPAPLQGA